MSQTIKEIYSLNQDNQNAEPEYALDTWYARLINKTADEIDLEDLSRMLSQNVFIDLGIKKRWKSYRRIRLQAYFMMVNCRSYLLLSI